MNQDGVSEAFELILEEITSVEDQLSAEGSSAFKEKRYEAAKSLVGAGERLQSFRKKLEALKREWGGVDPQTRKRVNVARGYTITPHTKGAATKLKVTLPNGHVLRKSTAAETFADALEAVGLDTVRKLELTVNAIPLVDDKVSGLYHQARRGRFFIITHSNTRSKKKLLEEIARKTGQKLKIEIV